MWTSPTLFLVVPFVAAAAASLVLVQAPDSSANATRAVPLPAVQRTYLTDCAWCHGSDGHGTANGPSIVAVGRAWTDYMLTTGRMPISSRDQTTTRHKPFYPPPMITGLVDYVAAFGPGGPDVPSVQPQFGELSLGGELFRLQCAPCHEWAGIGGALFHREAPPLRRDTPTQIAEAVRVGPDVMPAFGSSALDQHQLDSVVAYVRYLAKPKDRGGDPLWHLGPLAEGAVAWVCGMGLLLFTIRWIGERK